MSNFISPFLPRMLYVTSSLSSLISNAANQTNSNLTYPQIESKLTQLRSSMATLIPFRLLTPILNDQSHLSETKNSPYRITAKNIEYYMQMLVIAIRNVSQEDLLANIRSIRSMFMNLFEFRITLTDQFNRCSKQAKNELKSFEFAETLCKYEDHVINAFCELIFKLSEDLFKPIFFKLFEWATMIEAPKDRLITFYRTTYK